MMLAKPRCWRSQWANLCVFKAMLEAVVSESSGQPSEPLSCNIPKPSVSYTREITK